MVTKPVTVSVRITWHVVAAALDHRLRRMDEFMCGNIMRACARNAQSRGWTARDASNPGGSQPQKRDAYWRPLRIVFWAHLDLNQGPTDYESAALTAEL